MLESRPLYEIAEDIRANWKKVNFAAEPYLQAMRELNMITDMYMHDSAESIVRYFLSNASSFRGDAARRIKAELNELLN
jgi:hypothetical protein